MRADQMLSLQGKKAVVTGAGHGLGRAYAEAMAECGADVAVIDINAELVAETAAYVRSIGRQAFPLHADMTDETQVTKAMQDAVTSLGGLDIVFANVGGTSRGLIPPGGTFADALLGPWHKTMELNITSTMLTTREAAKHMMRLGKTMEHPGKIICTASIHGLVSGDTVDTVDYNTAKGAVVNFIRSAGTALAKHGINVNGIAPGPFDTHGQSPRTIEVGTRTPLGRHAEPHELKGAAVLLASAASDYMVGHIIVVDGGQTAR